MMNPANDPQLIASQRPAEPPTLWLSLALGSVLIHLVLFILASIVLSQTAKVPLDIEPIAVEFVDPNAARSTVSGGAIAARPGSPSSTLPSSTQIQPDVPQPSGLNQPIEQPFVPLQPVKRKRLPVQPQPQQTKPAQNPIQPPLTSLGNSRPQRSNPSNQSRGQTVPGTNPSQGGVAPNSGNGATGETEPESPVNLGTQIGQQPQGNSVRVVISNPRQPIADALKQAARPIELEKTVSVNYPSALAHQTIRLEASLYIQQDGRVADVTAAKLTSPESGIDPDTVIDIARQIFILSQWQFEPAQDDPGGLTVKLRQSNLIIDAQMQLP